MPLYKAQYAEKEEEVSKGNKLDYPEDNPDLLERVQPLIDYPNSDRTKEMLAENKVSSIDQFPNENLRSIFCSDDSDAGHKLFFEYHSLSPQQREQLLSNNINLLEQSLSSESQRNTSIYHCLAIGYIYQFEKKFDKSASYFQLAMDLAEGMLIPEARRIEQNEFAPLSQVPTGTSNISSCVYVAFCQNGQVGGFHLDVRTDPNSLRSLLADIPPGEVGIRIFGGVIYDEKLKEKPLSEHAIRNLNTVFSLLAEDQQHDFILLSSKVGKSSPSAVCVFPPNDKNIYFEAKPGVPYFEQDPNNKEACQERRVRNFLADSLYAPVKKGQISPIEGIRSCKKPYFLTQTACSATETEAQAFTKHYDGRLLTVEELWSVDKDKSPCGITYANGSITLRNLIDNTFKNDEYLSSEQRNIKKLTEELKRLEKDFEQSGSHKEMPINNPDEEFSRLTKELEQLESAKIQNIPLTKELEQLEDEQMQMESLEEEIARLTKELEQSTQSRFSNNPVTLFHKNKPQLSESDAKNDLNLPPKKNPSSP
jgi:hypothetical protein